MQQSGLSLLCPVAVRVWPELLSSGRFLCSVAVRVWPESLSLSGRFLRSVAVCVWLKSLLSSGLSTAELTYQKGDSSMWCS